MTIKNTGRLAGLFSLLTAITGGFGYAYLQKTIVRWDAAATAANLLANESMFRLAIVSVLVSQVLFFSFGVTLYSLLRKVNHLWATVFLAAILTCVTMTVINTGNSLGALWMLSGSEYLKVFTPDQLNAMSLTFLRMNGVGQGLLEIFWTPYYFALGLIAIKHRFLPKALGVIFILIGAGFWLNILEKFLAPQFHPLMFTRLAMIGAALGGVPLIFWLLIKGARVEALDKGSSDRPR